MFTFVTNIKIGNKNSDNGTDVSVKKYILPTKYSLIQQSMWFEQFIISHICQYTNTSQTLNKENVRTTLVLKYCIMYKNSEH
jgi:hypothetical protein